MVQKRTWLQRNSKVRAQNAQVFTFKSLIAAKNTENDRDPTHRRSSNAYNVYKQIITKTTRTHYV